MKEEDLLEFPYYLVSLKPNYCLNMAECKVIFPYYLVSLKHQLSGLPAETGTHYFHTT